VPVPRPSSKSGQEHIKTAEELLLTGGLL